MNYLENLLNSLIKFNYIDESKLIEQIMKTAMFVIDLTNQANHYEVIAYKSNIWKFLRENIDEKNISLINDFIDMNKNFEDIDSLIEYITDNRPDILYGYITEDNVFYLPYTQFNFSNNSILLNKVIKELNIQKVINNEMSYIGDNEETQLYQETDAVWYHGTSSKYILNILRFGLIPGKSESNFPGIISHSDVIFLTSNLNKARFHAHTAGKITKTDPIVISVKIPDTNFVVPDWDIDVSSSETLWAKGPKSLDLKMPQNSMALSNEFGVIGYKGRIPAKFIEMVQILPSEAGGNDWIDITLRELENYLEYGFFENIEVEDDENY